MADQPNIHIETGSSSDHDLLLTLKAELGTKLDRVIVDVKELKDNVAARVTDLEEEKADKSAFENLGTTVDSLQKLVYIGLGIILALQFAIVVYITYFKP